MDESTPAEPVEPGRIDVTLAPGAEVTSGPRRRRVVTGVIAAMLVAGSSGLGFGLGRSLGNDDASNADASVTQETTPVTPAPTAPPTTVAPAPTPTTAAPDTAVAAEGEGSPEAAPAADVAGLPDGGTEFDLVWEGSTQTGYRIRLQVGPSYEAEYMEDGIPGGWRPAAFCYGSGQMRLTVDGPDVVDVAGGAWFTEMYGDAEVVFFGDVGVADGRPMRVVVVQATESVTEVTASWDDGVIVTAPVESGVAVLAVDGGGTWEASLTVELVYADGERTSIPGGWVDRSSDPAWRAACSPPPPALPEAGEQPADPAAARAEIEARFALLWDQSIERADKPQLLDDDTGIDDAVAAVDEGGFAETARTAVFAVEELVFTAPDRAWFRYSIDTDVSFFGERFGVARLTDDGWIFPRAIMCQDLSLAGAMCDPGFQTIYPPSWYEINGQQCSYDPVGREDVCVTFEDSDIASW